MFRFVYCELLIPRGEPIEAEMGIVIAHDKRKQGGYQCLHTGHQRNEVCLGARRQKLDNLYCSDLFCLKTLLPSPITLAFLLRMSMTLDGVQFILKSDIVSRRLDTFFEY